MNPRFFALILITSLLGCYSCESTSMNQNSRKKHSFPVTQLELEKAHFGGTLNFNPYVDLEPGISWNAELIFKPIELGSDAIDPEIYGTTLDLLFHLDDIVLEERDWKNITGRYPQEDIWGNHSVYVCGAHNPVAINHIEFLEREGTRFKIKINLTIDFSTEAVAYENTTVDLIFDADFTGIVFIIPEWTDPDSVKFPRHWKIPEIYTEQTVEEMVSRFVDTSQYSLTRKGNQFLFNPR